MRWIVSVKPAEPGADGPHLVSDDPQVVQAVIEAITKKYIDAEDGRGSAPLRLIPEREPEVSS